MREYLDVEVGGVLIRRGRAVLSADAEGLYDIDCAFERRCTSGGISRSDSAEQGDRLVVVCERCESGLVRRCGYSNVGVE